REHRLQHAPADRIEVHADALKWLEAGPHEQRGVAVRPRGHFQRRLQAHDAIAGLDLEIYAAGRVTAGARGFCLAVLVLAHRGAVSTTLDARHAGIRRRHAGISHFFDRAAAT